MVRNYKRKTDRRKWTDKDMVKALEDAKRMGNIKAHGIPAITLRDRYDGRISVVAKYGRPTALTREEEDEIERLLTGGLVWGEEKWKGKIHLKTTPLEVTGGVDFLSGIPHW